MDQEKMGEMQGMGMHGMGMMPGTCMHGMGMGEYGWRKFMTKDEKIMKMEEYLKQLQMEEKGVMEKLAMMKSMK
jgi:hypothetical protein